MAAYDVTTSAASLDFNASNNAINAMVKVDTNHFMALFRSTATMFAQVLAVNTTTWAVTTTQAANFGNGAMNVSGGPRAIMVDTNHALVIRSLIEAANAQIYTINTTTWAVTTAAATFEFATATSSNYSVAKVDTNHFLTIFAKAGCNAQMITVNTTTWACTTSSARLNFDANEGEFSSMAQVDTNHFLVFWQGGAGKDGFAQVLAVNTTTFVVTTAAASLNFETQDCSYNACMKVDTNHFINFFQGFSADGFVQVFTVNTTTWAVTTAAASLEFNPTDASYNSIAQYDTNHFILFYRGINADGYAQVFEVNTTTWAVTTVGTELRFDTQNCLDNFCLSIDTSHFLNIWTGMASSTDGLAQVFQVEAAPNGPVNLKSLDTNAKANIKSYNGNPLANIKSINTNA